MTVHLAGIRRECLVLLGSLFLTASAGAQSVPDAWTPTRLTGPIEVDGNLDDPAWREAAVLSDFTQVEPVTGAEPSARTELRLAYTPTHLYFALVAHDAQPGDIVATQRRRDADLSADDNVVLIFDPFFDQRNGYRFSFNPLGARSDALIEAGETPNENWDGIWQVVSRRTDTGWQAEGVIPLNTISFNPTAEAWGFNVERTIARRNERVRWRRPSQQYAVSRLAEAGRLTGLVGLQRGLGLEWRPYASLTHIDDSANGNRSTRFKPGFDLSYKVTDSTTAVLTVNTDFADAEVDQRQVNLTRFPVSFPEKRAFFLQDASVFSFSTIDRAPLPFNSRRIGIGPRGEMIDLEAGLRITGREGPVNFGLLGVRMDSSGLLEAKELGVGRVSINILEESSFGLIGTYGDPSTNGDSWLVGTDFIYRSSRFLGRDDSPFEGSMYYQYSDNTGRSGDTEVYGYEITYDSPTWGVYNYWEHYGADYRPALGFSQQTGIWRANLRVDREFNPPGLRRVVPQVGINQRYSTVFNDREYLALRSGVSVVGLLGDSLTLNLSREREQLFESFTVAGGETVLPGDFESTEVAFSADLSRSRPLAGSIGITRSPYFGGRSIEYEASISWRPAPVFNMEAGYEYSDVQLPYTKFHVRLMRLSAAVQFSPDLNWSFLGQYDNVSRSLGLNTRIRWTYAPGGDIFFVVNQGIDTTNDRWDFTRTDISTKIGATFRF